MSPTFRETMKQMWSMSGLVDHFTPMPMVTSYVLGFQLKVHAHGKGKAIILPSAST